MPCHRGRRWLGVGRPALGRAARGIEWPLLLVTCRQSSTAQTRSRSNATANRRAFSTPSSLAWIVLSPRPAPVTASSATSVCVRLCASTPITIMYSVPSLDMADEADHWRTPLSRGAATLLLSHAGGPRSAAGDTAKAGQTPKVDSGKEESARRRPRTQPHRPDATDRAKPSTEWQRGGARPARLASNALVSSAAVGQRKRSAMDGPPRVNSATRLAEVALLDDACSSHARLAAAPDGTRAPTSPCRTPFPGVIRGSSV